MTAYAPVRESPLTRSGRRARLAVLGGLGLVTGYLAAVDPDDGGIFPVCPSRTLFGLDCPACGGLRGTHALLHGRVTEALDHNLLLPAILGVLGLALVLWMLPLLGRPATRWRPPLWLLATGVALAGAFMVTRNLPVPALEFLASDAT